MSDSPSAPPLHASAASLDGLTVTVPLAEELTVDDLVRRLHEKVRAIAKVRARAVGEPLSLGDDVQLDVLGYAAGRLIPFSARFGVWMELAPMAALPGFAEALAHAKVGDAVHVELTLPGDYPVEPLRGAPARFVVDVRAAREVKVPDPESPACLKALKLGRTLDEVMDAIRKELEAELTHSLWVEAENRVLDLVAERAQARVPKALVDDEIVRRWELAEGHAMKARGFDAGELHEAMNAWLEDPMTRAECERRLCIGLSLKAIAARDKLSLTAEKLKALAAGYGKPFGITPEAIDSALADARDVPAQLYDAALYLLVVEHVMAHASVTFEGAS